MLSLVKSKKNRKDNFVDYNIEYAHIYSDQDFNNEQIASINKTKEVINGLEKHKKTYSLVVLIDDYHPDQIKFDQQKFTNSLKDFGLVPDYITFESRLVDYKEDILNLLPANEVIKFNKYFKKREKLNCSFLIVGWYFLRLGLLPLKDKLIIKISKNRKPFCGKEIINILDEKYTDTEESTHRIIKKTVFKDAVTKIKKVFY
jgi:hypothetical protein